MPTERAKFPVAVHLFLRRGGDILLLRRFNTGYEDGSYSVIAGHADGGEDVYAAMLREAREEAGIEICRDDLRAVQVMHRNKPGGINREYIDYFFECRRWQGEVQNREPHKCDDLAWFPVGALPLNMVGYVRQAVQNTLEGRQFTLFGWE